MSRAHRQCAFAEHDDVHIKRLEVGGRIRILLKRAETDKVVVAEQLDLFSCFLHLDILSRQRMDTKDLIDRKMK